MTVVLPVSGAQKRVLDGLRAFCAAHGRSPSVRELGAATAHSATTTFQLLRALCRKGLVVGGGRTAHSYKPAEPMP